jgi:hypothetical protein
METNNPTELPQMFSTLSLDDVPDEVILRVFSNLAIKDFIRCGQVSKRIRAISQDQSLWLRIDLNENKSVAAGFLEYVINNGCKYLGLGFAKIAQIDGESLKCNPSRLKCLDLSFCQGSRQVFDDLLSSCHCLEKLALASQCHILLNKDLVKTMCHQFGATLQVLDVSNCYRPNMEIMDLEMTQLLIDSCSQLREVNFGNTYLSEESLDYVCNNLSEKIVKLGLCNQDKLMDKHITALVNRCNKLTSLDLENCCSISNISMTNIIESLTPCLEELVIRRTAIDYAKVVELQAMPKLKIFIFYQPSNKKLLKSYFLA